MKTIYSSKRRSDCTVVCKSLHKNGIDAITAIDNERLISDRDQRWRVQVFESQYEQAYALVWGDVPEAK